LIDHRALCLFVVAAVCLFFILLFVTLLHIYIITTIDPFHFPSAAAGDASAASCGWVVDGGAPSFLASSTPFAPAPPLSPLAAAAGAAAEEAAESRRAMRSCTRCSRAGTRSCRSAASAVSSPSASCCWLVGVDGGGSSHTRASLRSCRSPSSIGIDSYVKGSAHTRICRSSCAWFCSSVQFSSCRNPVSSVTCMGARMNGSLKLDRERATTSHTHPDSYRRTFLSRSRAARQRCSNCRRSCFRAATTWISV
jgi:hypothetical protein